MAPSGLVRGHHLHPDAPRLPVSSRHHVVVFREGASLAYIQQVGSRPLHGGFERGDPKVSPVRIMSTDHGPQCMSLASLDGQAEKGRLPHLHGRQKTLYRQPLQRAAVAIP